ncbi:MAG: endonuclease VII domain-containing protein [Candidatus Aminicenantes bacterium]|nr:endonuclease VII domain-containing protein [Candidatus Aminicenantes bacterium]
MPRPRKNDGPTLMGKKAYDKAYDLAHRAEKSTYNKAYHEAHRDKVLGRQKIYAIAQRKEIASRQKAWGAAHRDETRARRLKRNYGLTIKAFGDLLLAQGAKCAVCRRPEWGRGGPVVDHDHKAGNVRGILCGRCNMAAGLLGDDSKIAQMLSDYLKER